MCNYQLLNHLTTVPIVFWWINFVILNNFWLPKTLFEAGGAVFIMNSSIPLLNPALSTLCYPYWLANVRISSQFSQKLLTTNCSPRVFLNLEGGFSFSAVKETRSMPLTLSYTSCLVSRRTLARLMQLLLSNIAFKTSGSGCLKTSCLSLRGEVGRSRRGLRSSCF